MFLFNIVLSFIIFLSYLADNKRNELNLPSFPIVLMTGTIASLLAGFRIKYNDTERYIYNFNYLVENNLNEFLTNLDLTIGNNPGFYIYQFLIKNYISDSSQFFLVISSIITYVSIFLFIRKYSIAYHFTIFLIITSGFFMLGMAAIKQMLAISIGIWFISYYIEKKYIMMFLVLLISSTFHPFILLFLLIFIIDDKVWSKKIILAFIGIFILGGIFKTFVINILAIGSNFGIDYESSYILEAQGMNILRVLLFSIVPILSYVYKNEIHSLNSKILTISINFSIIGFMFIILASYGGANMFGRLGSYFEIFYYLSLTFIIFYLFNTKLKYIAIIVLTCSYLFFFYYEMFIVKKFQYVSIFNMDVL
jgi:hypothetical protein